MHINMRFRWRKEIAMYSIGRTNDPRHEKTDIKVFVVVIPKEGWARMAAPILLLVWHRLFENIIFGFLLFSLVHWHISGLVFIATVSVSSRSSWSISPFLGLFSRDMRQLCLIAVVSWLLLIFLFTSSCTCNWIILHAIVQGLLSGVTASTQEMKSPTPNCTLTHKNKGVNLAPEGEPLLRN